MLSRVIVAAVIAAVSWLICVFIGGLLAITGVPILAFVGGFLVQWAVLISILVFVYTLFVGGGFAWPVKAP